MKILITPVAVLSSTNLSTMISFSFCAISNTPWIIKFYSLFRYLRALYTEATKELFFV